MGNTPVKIFCKREECYCLTIRDGMVVLAKSDPKDCHQVWYKDERYSNRVKDASGRPGFALINKATGLAIKHATAGGRPVSLTRFNAAAFDDSIMWSSDDLGEDYLAIRMISNTLLNFDANKGRVSDGTLLVLYDWKADGGRNNDNQHWKICPCPEAEGGHGEGGDGEGGEGEGEGEGEEGEGEEE